MRRLMGRIRVRAAVATLAAVCLGVFVALLWRSPDRSETGESEAHERSAPFVPRTPGDGLASGLKGQRVASPLWRIVDEGSVQIAPPYGKSWSESGRVLVDVTAAAIGAHAWRVGDRLAVEVPPLGGVQEWAVERIDDGMDDRSRSVRGWIDVDGKRWRVVVTVGPGRVLAYIDTPEGPYELTGNARLAWLLPSSSMMAGIDFSEPDYLLPDRQRGDREIR